MKKVAIVVLALVVIAAVFALYILISDKGITGKMTCDPYSPYVCNVARSDTCCFTVVYYDGTKFDYCYDSYRFAVENYRKFFYSDSMKTNSGISYVEGFRVGPSCIY